ncbi:MAG: hypothetical protein IJV77_07810 [Clostridia bacterium]|nr:hypothetical protein [Clostridia bacterium]
MKKRDPLERKRQLDRKKYEHVSYEEMQQAYEKERECWLEREKKKIAFANRHKTKFILLACITSLPVCIFAFVANKWLKWFDLLSFFATLFLFHQESLGEWISKNAPKPEKIGFPPCFLTTLSCYAAHLLFLIFTFI